ncbi:hypothetical protein TURU_001374 [Turdus rufiventris]|nr:hypothetical protein TURU_001374 [Turdus rufiventris]
MHAGTGDVWCDPLVFLVTSRVTGRSCPLDSLVLQVPAQALLEGDTVTLRCRGRRNLSVTWVSFYRDGKELATIHKGPEMSLSPLQLNHSSRYRCKAWVDYLGWEESEAVPMRVQVAAGLGGSLLFLLLLVAGAVGCHRWNNMSG